MSISLWVPILLFGLLLVLGVCVGMSLDTDKQRTARQQLADERYVIRAERELLARERRQHAERLQEWRERGSAPSNADRADGEDTRQDAPPTPVA